MNSISYKMNVDVVSRHATNLVFKLAELKSSIYIENLVHHVNGKSITGVLTAHIRCSDIIKISFDNIEDQSRIQEIFNEYGTQV